MEKERLENNISFRTPEDAEKYLPCIDRPELHRGICEAISENDEALREICCGDQTVGLALIDDGGDEGYVYIFIFPEYRGRGYGRAAEQLAEQQIMSPELHSIYTSFDLKDEDAQRFARKCGYPRKFASAFMRYPGAPFALPELPIREYEDRDYPEAQALSAEAFHRMRLETGSFPESAPEKPSEGARKYWAETADERYIYEADGEIAGYANLNGAELDSVSVRISRQGEGLGRNFVKYLVNRILEKEEGAPQLWCVIGNDKARKLYDSLGFEEQYSEEYDIKPVTRISEEQYSFELPERWKDLVGVKHRGNRADLVLLGEEEPGCSGLLVSLKCLKRRKAQPDEYTELLGTLTHEDGTRYYLYAAYGQEGTVSEMNEDLYWRLRDQLWMVFESIWPSKGYRWEKA